MTRNNPHDEGNSLSRRRALGLGLGAGLGIVLGARAVGTVGAMPRRIRTAPPTTSGDEAPWLPSYTPPQSLPGTSVSSVEGVGPAFESYPDPAFVSVQSPPLTSGNPVTTFQILYPAPPPSLSDNQWWQEFNERLGGEFEPTLVPAQGYADRLQTTIAGGDMPDIMFVEPGQGAPSVVRTFQEGAFTDLTDVLVGDGVNAYPNLAQVPTYAWKNSAIEGRIYGVPRPVDLLIADAGFSYRMDWAAEAGWDSPPTNAEELLEFFKAFTSDGRWAIGALYPRWYHMMFRVPNNWRLESDGTLTNAVETDELEQSLTFQNRMWNEGVFHPDAPTQAWTAEAEEVFFSDQVAAIGGGLVSHFGTGTNAAGNFRRSHPDVELGHLLPVGHDGGEPLIHQRQGFFGIFAVPASVGEDSERLAELLRFLDYTGAPFGSEEFLFMNYGIEGTHYTRDENGNPQPVDDPVIDERNGSYLNQPIESVFYVPGAGESVAAQQYVEQAAQSWVTDPTLGLISETNIRSAAALRQLEDDYQLGIITGRRPMSDLEQWRNEWRSQGGDDVRSEFEEALQRVG
jgi:putative aldouronate transport system substrate-binding protein